MISAVMDKSTLEFYLIGDAYPDALGLLCGFGFQRGKAGHGGFGGKDLLQLRTDSDAWKKKSPDFSPSMQKYWTR